MVKYFCDRCGNEIETKPESVGISFGDRAKKHYDFCQSCSDKLHAFLDWYTTADDAKDNIISSI